MDAEAPTIFVPVFCAPKKAPCPKCGKKGVRQRFCYREVRTLMYHEIAVLDITYGEYEASCDCCKTFRTNPDGVLPKAKYDNKVRQAVLDRIVDDGMNVEATLHSLRRDFLLDLSTGFVYDCLYDAAAATDMGEHRQQVLERFSGVLCVDEIHLGKFTLLLATDPVGDFPVAFALVSANDKEHMARFLGNLKNWGLAPKVVVTDRSSLYPALLAELWPLAQHQLCVFHIMQDINDLVLEALRRMRGKLNRQGKKGKRRRRGRPSKAQRKRAKKRGPTAKDKAHFVFKRRYLIVTREEKLSQSQRKDLQKMLEYLPALRTLRKFVKAIHRLFATDQSEPQAWCRWHALMRSPEYKLVPELAEVLEILNRPAFYKMVAYLRGPASRRVRVRTNNHVERCNRKLRFLEKVRYKWRRARTLVRFLVLAMNHVWKTTLPAVKPRRKRRLNAKLRVQAT